ncbi:hypothetical protein IJG93_03855 [Candidatus Saccharibacteria bacterium]|nr:hypothetical protein [Candidatus Saccharibacteria bacterium]
MKKSIIAAGAASVALAAMPILGAFAIENTTDNITAVIDDGCTITDSVQNKTVSMVVAPGSVATSTAAPSISVVCNNNDWDIQAQGTSNTYEQAGFAATDLVARNGAEGSYTYEHIATGGATSGSTSNWAFKVVSLSDTTNAAIATGYDAWNSIPAFATTIVEGSAAATETVTTQYQVFAAVGQAAGSYNGQVTYTVVEN